MKSQIYFLENKTIYKIFYNYYFLENIQVDDLGKASVPPQYLCPITHKILKEPVIATSKVYYEKSALEKYLLSSKDPICLVKGSKLDVKENIGLQIDKVMQTQINDWVKANN